MMKPFVGAISAGLVIILSLFVWFYSRTFPSLPDGHPGPGLFPRAVAAGMFIAGCYLALRALRGEPAGASQELKAESVGKGLSRIGVVLLALGLYPFLTGIVGFVPTVSGISFIVALLLKAKPLQSAATALGGTLFVYLLFTRLLGVPL